LFKDIGPAGIPVDNAGIIRDSTLHKRKIYGVSFRPAVPFARRTCMTSAARAAGRAAGYV
jgi:hypothetical protein